MKKSTTLTVIFFLLIFVGWVGTLTIAVGIALLGAVRILIKWQKEIIADLLGLENHSPFQIFL